MSIKFTSYGPVDVLSLSGKLMGGPEIIEIHSAIKATLEKKVNHIVIDLKDVKWMGSVGIGILICCLTTVRAAGGDLKLSGLSKKAESLLLMTNLDKVFEIYPKVDKAVNSFNIH